MRLLTAASIIAASIIPGTLLLASPAICAEDTKVIVVDDSGSYKRSLPKPGPDTKDIKVISIKGTEIKDAGEPDDAPEDVCSLVGSRFYCAHLGKTAVEKTTGEPLGEIIGVAWKGRNEAVTRYLPPDWLMRDEGKTLEINAPAGGEGFFYIVKTEGRMTFMVECVRINPQTD
ncbi:MAG: hypothetical protein KAR83_08830 [Thermodesulfovibrionales bacterium]|nr:hypothetical protein [Thermodesulfovibrionales bacterium]